MSTRQIRDGRKVELYSTYLPNGTLDTPDTSKIVNGNNHKRVLNLLANSKGQTILGGGNGEHKIELTVPKDVPADDPFPSSPWSRSMALTILYAVGGCRSLYHTAVIVPPMRHNPSASAVYQFTNQRELREKRGGFHDSLPPRESDAIRSSPSRN